MGSWVPAYRGTTSRLTLPSAGETTQDGNQVHHDPDIDADENEASQGHVPQQPVHFQGDQRARDDDREVLGPERRRSIRPIPSVNMKAA
jgi:hypothetical protein